jgi:hypothetical protein
MNHDFRKNDKMLLFENIKVDKLNGQNLLFKLISNDNELIGISDMSIEDSQQEFIYKILKFKSGRKMIKASIKITILSNSDKKLTIKDLCPEEKAKIGELLKKLAEEKAEKENILKQAEEERQLYESRIDSLVKEKYY